MTTTGELVWRCRFGVEACNPLTKDKFSKEHSGCHWVPAPLIEQGPEKIVDESSPPEQRASDPAYDLPEGWGRPIPGRQDLPTEDALARMVDNLKESVAAAVAKRATMKGKMGDTFGCRCGATFTCAELHSPGAVIGVLEAARAEFRRIHSEPGCTEWR